MIIHTLAVGPLATNCYLISDSDGNAAIIDPGDEADSIVAKLESESCEPLAVFLTHGHWDHIGALPDLLKLFAVPVYVHSADAALLGDAQANLSVAFGPGERIVSTGLTLVSDGGRVAIGELEYVVLETPGHTRGGISLKLPGAVFTGDALFAGSIGRTDLPGGSYETLIHSITEKLLSLPDETAVYPGHGPATTVGAERVGNPYLA